MCTNFHNGIAAPYRNAKYRNAKFSTPILKTVQRNIEIMKILFLTEQFPYPLHDGGNLRTFHILAGLVQQHDVTLVAHEPPSGMQNVAKFPLDCNVVIAQKSSVVSRVVGGIENWDRSLFLSKNWSENLLAAAERELRKNSYDVIHFNHLDTACYALRAELVLPKSV